MSSWELFDLKTDPYAEWISTNGQDYPIPYKLESSLIPVFVSMDGISSKKFFDDLTQVVNRKDGSNLSFVPDPFLYPENVDRGTAKQSFGLFVTGKLFEVLSTDKSPFISNPILRSDNGQKPNVRFIPCQQLPIDAHRPENFSSDGNDTVATKAPEPEPLSSTSDIENSAVVIGVIDEGIAFANERFCNLSANGNLQSRVEYAWIQDGAYKPRAEQNKDGSPVQPRYGREHSRAEIDVMLAKCQSDDRIDEDKFYEMAGLIDYRREGLKTAARRLAHGTHVMDIACGYPLGTSPKIADKEQKDKLYDARPIISVQLPTKTVADTSGLGLERYYLDGVRYILRRAREIADQHKVVQLPVVINFSSGIFAGPHDGKHPLEIEIEKLLEKERLDNECNIELVLPAGNSLLSQTHARFDLDPKGADTATWRVQPDDKTFNFMEIWLPEDAELGNGQLPLTVTTPGGNAQTIVNDGKSHGYQLISDDEKSLAKIYYEIVDRGNDGNPRERYMIITAPTEPFTCPNVPVTPIGDWKISFENKSKKPQTIHAWIQWDDRPLNYPILGRQSYFIDENYKKYDDITGRPIQYDEPKPRCENVKKEKCLPSYIKRDGTISGLATGSETIVVGGYVGKDHMPTDYSAAGEEEGIPHPTAVAVTDASLVSRGILAAGTRSGSVVAMDGTSVAAPQVTRWLADKIVGGSEGSRNSSTINGRGMVNAEAGRNQQFVAPHIDHHHVPDEVDDPHKPARIGAGRMPQNIHLGVDRRTRRLRIPEQN